jgi:fructuronate reductase
MLWVHRCATGESSGLTDPLADELATRAAAASSPDALAGKLIALREVFDADLAEDRNFRADIVGWLTALWSARPATALRALTRG